MSKRDGESESKHLVRFGWYELPENNPVVRFCQDSGLHGLKYITGPSQHLCERLLWLAAVISATVAGSALIYKTWDQYYTLPVIIVPSPKPLSIEEIPFPSVTVCALNRVKRDTYEKYYKLANQDENVNNISTINAKEIVKILDSFCDPSNVFGTSWLWKVVKIFGIGVQSAFLNLEISQSFKNESKLMKLLNESSQSCESLIPTGGLENAYWKPFSEMEQVETDFGICCTFNAIPYLSLKPWRNVSMEGEYRDWHRQLRDNVSSDTLIFTDKTKRREFPHRQKATGSTFGLSFLIATNTTESHCNNSDMSGFLVSIANPLDTPSTRDKENFIGLNTEVFFNVKPKLTLADDSIKRFAPKKRGCYFDNEVTLRDYSVYTQNNCLQECLANLTMDYCQIFADCVDSGSMKEWLYSHVCEPVRNCSSTKRLELSYEKRFKTPIFYGTERACKHCLPTCNNIKYEYKTDVKHLNDYYIRKLKEDNFFGTRMNSSIVHVYFGDYYAATKIRKEQFGILELLANSGGLLGLCLGFSGISILEIIYYFTIRVCFRHFRHKMALKKSLSNVLPDDTLNTKGDVDGMVERSMDGSLKLNEISEHDK